MSDTHAAPGNYDVAGYFALAECGILAPDDRVELLEGQIVSMAPASPLHCAVVHHVAEVLKRRLGPGVLVRTQSTFVAGRKSAPEPDVAVLPGRNADYLRRHPSKAMLVIEVADSSLPQDRLTKAAIYARAAVPEYWIVNLRNGTVEWHRDPDEIGRRYTNVGKSSGDARLAIAVFPDAKFEAREFFPEDLDE